MQNRFGVFAILGSVWLLLSPVTVSAAPPNIVLILIDDLGWRDLGCYGSDFYETPRIDRLAAGGMRFSAAYTAAPVCSPTRASLLTGKSPARLGFSGHITSIRKYRHPEQSLILPPRDHMKLRLQETTLAEALKPAGYVSASIGKWHLGPENFWPRDQGFDVNVAGWTNGSPPSHFFPYQDKTRPWNRAIPTMSGGEPGEYLTDRLTDEAVKFIKQNRDQPFFLYLTHYAVHAPVQAPDELTEKYREKMKTNRSQKNAVYAGMVEAVDASVGRITDLLRELDLEKNTIVVFFSDNGGLASSTNNAPLRGSKQDLYEGGIRVPLIVRWPGKIPAESSSDVPVISHDLLPTLLDLADQNSATPDQLDGVSLKPILTDGGGIAARKLYWYYPLYARRPGSVVLDGPWKMIEFYDPPAVELYHLSDDLSETRDLATEHPDRVAGMRADLQAWLEETKAIRHTPNPKARQ